MKSLSNNYTENSSLIFYGILSAVAFGLNWIWEIGYMFAYAAESNDSVERSFIFYTLGSVTGALVTVAIYFFWELFGKPSGARFFWVAAFLVAMFVIAFECFTIGYMQCPYGKKIVVLPVSDFELLPYVKLMLLVPPTIWIAKKIFKNFKKGH